MERQGRKGKVAEIFSPGFVLLLPVASRRRLTFSSHLIDYHMNFRIRLMQVADPTGDRVIVSTRVVNAPPSIVFKAWTEPERLERWWGPNGFTSTISVYDLRPGGRWVFVMHGPEKGHYPNDCTFVEIAPPHRLTWTRNSQPHFDVEACFHEEPDGKTRVVFTMLFATSEECDKLRKYVVEKNEENLDKLENELATMM
jgi:uncharacterized protein YndB with AHSA1/START domain